MSEASSADLPPYSVCPVCGARQSRPRQSCWMCGGDLGANAPPGDPPSSLPPLYGTPPQHAGAPHSHFSFSISTLLLVTTLVAACCALLSAVPGLGILVCILLVPVLVRTVKVVERREAAGAHVSTSEKIALGATSFAATTVIVIVVGFATFCCFCAVCATLFSFGSGESQLLLLGIAAASGAAVAIFICVQLFKWSRRRFERDIQVTKHDEP